MYELEMTAREHFLRDKAELEAEHEEWVRQHPNPSRWRLFWHNLNMASARAAIASKYTDDSFTLGGP